MSVNKGVLPDPAVARRTDRSVSVVGKKRLSLGRPPLAEGPDGPHLKYWTAADDRAVRTFAPEAAARRTGRSLKTVYRRRAELGLTAR